MLNDQLGTHTTCLPGEGIDRGRQQRIAVSWNTQTYRNTYATYTHTSFVFGC